MCVTSMQRGCSHRRAILFEDPIVLLSVAHMRLNTVDLDLSFSVFQCLSRLSLFFASDFFFFFFGLSPFFHTTMMAKLNVSKRTVVALTAFSIILTLLCLFYATNRNNNGLQSAGGYAKTIESNATSLQQPQLPIKCIENTADRNQIKLTKQAWNQCLDAGATPEYYLSIVIVTRMDDYAGYVTQYHVCPEHT